MPEKRKVRRGQTALHHFDLVLVHEVMEPWGGVEARGNDEDNPAFCSGGNKRSEGHTKAGLIMGRVEENRIAVGATDRPGNIVMTWDWLSAIRDITRDEGVVGCFGKPSDENNVEAIDEKNDSLATSANRHLGLTF
jgi:hypothetical protein